jgi:S-adenosylmethionine:tRNA ribosyltransferase-isomerase
MLISDFDYELPPERIAREPARPRDASRMMVLHRAARTCADARFNQLPRFLRRGDVLVINDTRVIRARIHGTLQRATGSTRLVEVLFANPVAERTWEVLCKPGRRVRPGDRIVFAGGAAGGIVGEARDHGLRLIEIHGAPVMELLDMHGRIPLPPYLGRPDTAADADEYQTVFAANAGAVAAPTAGLHFTPAVLRDLAEHGVEIASLTLHVGIGTFLPIRADDPRQHRLKPEWFNIPEIAAAQLTAARAEGRRIIAVGTTSTRTLEYVAGRFGGVRACSGFADLYIVPGYRFQAIDGLLTNFHLPRSTLLLLVSAFATRDFMLEAYRRAVALDYRFYSYGDCMLIL